MPELTQLTRFGQLGQLRHHGLSGNLLPTIAGPVNLNLRSCKGLNQLLLDQDRLDRFTAPSQTFVESM